MEVCVRRMLERKVDGIAIMTSERDAPLIEQLARRRIPIAFLDVGPERKHFWNIEVNYAMGIGEAVDHLRGLGHECIAFISGPQALYSAQTRREAFLAKVKTGGQTGSEPNVVEGDHTVDGGLIAMQTLLAKHPRCSAVIGSNDLSAIGALRAIHRAGLRIPEDISLVGFDDIHLADFTEPPLTTIRLSRIDVATRAISWLIAEIEERQPPEKLVSPIETHLVIRQSTARVNGTAFT
jgi:LacI family transcriptional regulator